jgi:hypothetical protein
MADRIGEQLQISSSNRNNTLDVSRMSSLSQTSNLGLQDEVEDNISFNVPVFNAFGSLNPNASSTPTPAASTSAASTSAAANKPKTKEKTKPIYVKNVKIDDLIKFLKAISVNEFNMKIISGGIKLLVNKTEDFKKSKNALLQQNAEFYTYALPDELAYKVVLYGLPPYQPEEVKEFLAEKGVPALDVKKVNIKKTRF